MRVEPHDLNSILHVVKRGARGLEITRDEADRRRFVNLLYLLNDAYSDLNWTRAVSGLVPFERPAHWPDREPIVGILAWTLMPNHFHLVLKEVKKGGIAKFMQRLCGSMSVNFNAKYEQKGSIFQGGYRGKVVDDDNYLRYLVFYVLVKNVLELHRGGLAAAMRNFDDAWKRALEYQYSSLPVYAKGVHSLLMDSSLVGEIVSGEAAFKREAKDMLGIHMASRPDDFASILLEEW